MSIVTPCGNPVNEADCGYCLKIKDCREACEQICRGCIREGICPAGYKHTCAEGGVCRGRELTALREFTQLHGKGH